MKKYLILLLFCTACKTPELRIFEKKIDPKMAEAPVLQVESQRQAADFISAQLAQLIAGPNYQTLPDFIRNHLQGIYRVSVLLNASLGQPNKSIVDQTIMIRSLQDGLRAANKRADDWEKFAQKYGNKTIEDTGVNVFAPTALLGVAGVVALCIIFPGFLTVVFWFFRKMRIALVDVVHGIEEFKKKNPDKVEELEATLARPMDKSSKAVIKRFKKFVPKPDAPTATP